MKTHLCLLIVAALAEIQAKAHNSKNGDGIVIDSEHTHNNEIYQQKETLISRLSGNILKDDDCKDGEKKPSTESCRKYYVCNKNKYEEDSCWFPWKFDSEKLECVLWGAKCAEPDPVTKPTDPVTKPTEPVTEPTDPVTGPTSSVTKPTGPVTKPTGPVTKPTGPVTEPTGPVTEPTGPVTEPTGPDTEPPVPDPTKAGTSSAGNELPPLIIITLFTVLHTTFSLSS